MSLFGGVGNSKSSSSSKVVNNTTNLTQGVQEGGVNINAAKGSSVSFTDGGTVERAFDFAKNNQAYANKNFSSVIGLANSNRKILSSDYRELIKANNSITERALESAKQTKSQVFESLKNVTGKIASIAQSQAGDVKPLVTSAIIGLTVIGGLFYLSKKI